VFLSGVQPKHMARMLIAPQSIEERTLLRAMRFDLLCRSSAR
jgi:hypothetical protein